MLCFLTLQRSPIIVNFFVEVINFFRVCPFHELKFELQIQVTIKKKYVYINIYTPVFKKVDVLKIYIKYTYLLYSCQNCQNKQKRAIDICLLIYILRTSTFLKTAVYIYISCFMRNTPMAPLHNMCFLSVMVQKIVLCDCLKMLFTLVLQQSIENCSNNSFICSCAFYLCCQGEKLAWMYMYLSWVTNHS